MILFSNTCGRNTANYQIRRAGMSTDRYVSPLSERYASKEMQYIFSPDMKFRTWRRLWIALAETEKELGLARDGKPVITQEQIDELKSHAEDINYEVAKAREKEVRHDVMSHLCTGRRSAASPGWRCGSCPPHSRSPRCPASLCPPYRQGGSAVWPAPGW